MSVRHACAARVYLCDQGAAVLHTVLPYPVCLHTAVHLQLASKLAAVLQPLWTKWWMLCCDWELFVYIILVFNRRLCCGRHRHPVLQV